MGQGLGQGMGQTSKVRRGSTPQEQPVMVLAPTPRNTLLSSSLPHIPHAQF